MRQQITDFYNYSRGENVNCDIHSHRTDIHNQALFGNCYYVETVFLNCILAVLMGRLSSGGKMRCTELWCLTVLLLDCAYSSDRTMPWSFFHLFKCERKHLRYDMCNSLLFLYLCLMTSHTVIAGLLYQHLVAAGDFQRRLC